MSSVQTQAVTAPAENISPLQMEAHTKLVLVNLIVEGKVRFISSYIIVNS